MSAQTYEEWIETRPIDWGRPGTVRQGFTVTEEYINHLARAYWQARPHTGEIDFIVASQEAAEQLNAAIQRYNEFHTPVDPPKPVEDPFLNHYL